MAEQVLRKQFATTIFKAFDLTEEKNEDLFKALRTEIEDRKLMLELHQKADNDFKYNYFLVEQNVSDASSRIRACVQRREELLSMEEKLLSDSLRRLILKDRRVYEDSLAKEQEAFSDSSLILNKQSGIAFKGGKINAEINSSKKIGAYEKIIQELTITYRNSMRVYEDQFNDFSELKNSGLNYLHRYLQLKALYQFDYLELFEKLKAVEVGVQVVYNLKLEDGLAFPKLKLDNNSIPFSSNDYLNELFIWLKKIIYQLGQLTEDETETVIKISTKDGYYLPGADSPIRVFEEADWKLAIVTGLLKFTLPKEIFSGLSYVRLKNFEVSLRYDGNKNKNEFYTVKITPPPQRSLQSGQPFQLPHYIHIAYDDYTHEVKLDKVNTLNIFNIDPCAGSWIIELSKKSNLATPITVEGDSFGDLFLHLRFASKNSSPSPHSVPV